MRRPNGHASSNVWGLAQSTYLRNLSRRKLKLEHSPNSPEWNINLQIAISQVECIAHKLISNGRFALGLECVDEVLAIDTGKLELRANRAVALMFLNRDDEVRSLFLEFSGRKIGHRTWELTITKHFEKRRKLGRSHSLMEEIKNEFAAGGHIVSPPIAKPSTIKGTSVSRQYIRDVQVAENVPL